jgi:hypothetical protein
MHERDRQDCRSAAALGEIGTCLWLLVTGAHAHATPAATSAD